jgi:preprotein translocase subunit SecF
MLNDNMMNLLKHKMVYLILSAVLLVPGIFYLLRYGLSLSIDFTGGSIVSYQLNYSDQDYSSEFKEVFKSKGVEPEEIKVEKGSPTRVIVRTKQLEVSKNEEVKGALTEKYKDLSFKQDSFQTVGPAIGAETAKNAFLSLVWASIGILLYIAFAFRNVPKPYSSFKFGLSAIIAMLHDALMVIGIFAILGHHFKVEIDGLFITALLTVIGFSVHDTIVVFDRIRENLRKLPRTMGFEEVANYSIVETLSRSLATSFTVIITLFSLYMLGGETIRNFVLAMLVGVISGTYSSVFTATPILVLWETYQPKKKI